MAFHTNSQSVNACFSSQSLLVNTAKVITVLSIGLLTACQQANQKDNTAADTKTPTASSSNAATTNAAKMTIYTSTNVWGSIAKAVGGDKVDVIAAVNDPTQDPHDYQASAQDKLNISKAQLVLVNGGGYDDWVTSLADSVENKPVVINAVDLSGLQPESMKVDEHGHDDDHAKKQADEHQHEHEMATDSDAHDPHSTEHADEHNDEPKNDHQAHALEAASDKHAHHHHGEFNEHVFFSLDTAKKVAQAVANQLSAKDPTNKAIYAQNAQNFMQQVDGLKIKAKSVTAGKSVAAFATEPVTGYLLADMGIKDITPEGYIEQSETDAGVSVKVLNDSKTLLSTKQAALMVANAQTEDATAKTLMDTATKAGVPIVQVNETFPAGVTSYTDFIEKTIDNFANALK